MTVMCWYDLFVIRWPVFFISVLRMQELSLRVCVVSLTQLFLWPPSSALPNYTPCLFDERRQRTMVEWCTFNWALSVIDVLYYRPHPLFSIWTLKGIVHPKMKILSSFTHPRVVPNLYECVCSAEHKGRYSEECGKQSSSGAPLTSIVFFFLLWKSMVPQNSLVTNFIQNIFLCVQQNKDIHTGLERLERE